MDTMTTQTISTSLSDINEELATFTHEQCHEALMYAQMALERALCPFVLLDETARQMMQELPTLKLSEISIGIMKNHWTDSTKSIFRMVVPNAEVTNVNVTYIHNNVPVIMWIIEREYSFFKNPDLKFYYNSEFYVPNPWRDYWKSRDLIK